MTTVQAPAGSGERFTLIGNELAIDFANTVYDRQGSADTLRAWADVVDFLLAAGALEPTRAQALRAKARRAPAEAHAAFAQALSLRGALRHMLSAIAAGRRLRPAWIATINATLRYEQGYPRLACEGGELRLAFVPADDQPVRLLGPLARSAARLLIAAAAAPVRKCANPTCVLYFRDVSRTGRRRWCAMSACGNRAKVRAYFERSRGKVRSRQPASGRVTSASHFAVSGSRSGVRISRTRR